MPTMMVSGYTLSSRDILLGENPELENGRAYSSGGL
jgi:hypothetical protein